MTAALQYGIPVQNARLDAIETSIGASPIMEVRAGAKPADCSVPATGAILATINLPSDWMANASGGVKSLSGVWQDLSADSDGIAGYFRVYDAGRTFVGMQGTVSATGGGGVLQFDNVNFTAGQQVTVTAFQIGSGNK